MQLSNQPFAQPKSRVQNQATSVSTSVRQEQKAEAAVGTDSSNLDSSTLDMV